MIRRTTPLSFAITQAVGLALLLFGLFTSPAYSASSIQLTWNPSPEPDLMGYSVYMGTSQGSYTTTDNAGLTPSYTFQNLPAGTYYFTVTAYDQSGNISAPAQEVAIALPPQGGGAPPPDTTPPTIALVNPQNSTPLSGTITLSATATDNIGVMGVQFKLNGNNLGPEDTTNPFSSSWNTTSVLDGSYTLSATARDAAGNTTTAAPVTVNVSNTTSPALIISNLTVASGQPYVVPTAGLQVGRTVYKDRSFTFTTVPTNMQGAAYIQTANDDKAGTNAAFISFQVNQPVTVYVAHDVRITPKPAWLTTFTDTGKDLGTSDTTLHLLARTFSAGTISLGGNAGSEYSMYSVIVKPDGGTPADTTPPTVTLTAPSAGTVSGTVTVSASAGDNVGVTGVQFRLQGANLGPEDTSSPYSTSWNTTTAPNGSYTLTAIARDAAGNSKTAASVTVTVSNTTTPPPPPADTTPPTVTLTAPSAGTVSGTVTVSASAGDNVGVTGVQFRLQGANLGPEDTSSPYSTSWNTTTVPNGSYTLTAIARDAAGNTTTAALVTVTVSNNIPTKNHDLNGDSKADLVWRNTKTGAVAGWLLNGTSVADSGFLGQLPTEWALRGVGDLNGDGKADVVWRNDTSGAVAVWLMNGVTMTSVGFPGTASTAWEIQGVGDMNGDGMADLLWRHTNGNTVIWLMNGTAVASTGSLGGVSLAWQIAGMGDVNADGKADIIWRNGTSGAVAVWLMNGVTMTSVGFPGNASSDWAIQGVGDMNGDGMADLLWRHTNGNAAVWFLNGTALASTGSLGGVPLVWKIGQVGDVDADGNADILWRNSGNGALAVWLMNGVTITSTGFPGAASTDWEIR